MSVSVVIPLFNELHYTKMCLESFQGTPAKIYLINNGSSDWARAWLESLKDVEIIDNPDNLGCAPAWNQGVLACDGDWIVILNNDVIVSPGWLEGLIAFAEEHKLDIVSPAIREGEYNYDMKSYSRAFVSKMKNVSRFNIADGICFMIRKEVFHDIGLFDENFKIGQFEDIDFFKRARNAGFRIGTTGRSIIHHHGSTPVALIDEQENRAYYHQKWKITPWRQFWIHRKTKLRHFFWRLKEKWLYGHSLKMKWLNNRLHYF